MKGIARINRQSSVQMANKFMKKCSTFLAIKVIQIKTTKIFVLPQLEWPYSRTKTHQMLVRMWQNKNPYTVLVGMEIITTIMEGSMEIPQKAKDRTAV
jgi:hypothetical protein